MPPKRGGFLRRGSWGSRDQDALPRVQVMRERKLYPARLAKADWCSVTAQVCTDLQRSATAAYKQQRSVIEYAAAAPETTEAGGSDVKIIQ